MADTKYKLINNEIHLKPVTPLHIIQADSPTLYNFIGNSQSEVTNHRILIKSKERIATNKCTESSEQESVSLFSTKSPQANWKPR
jgi:hypothetical protein